MWCGAKLNEEYKVRMEDVLRCSEKPLNPKEPVIGVDEVRKQLLAEKRAVLPGGPGKVYRPDSESVRLGTRNLFVRVNPKQGQRRVEVTEHRAKPDFAHFRKTVIETDYPQAQRIPVIRDNLHTQNESSCLEAFGKREGPRLWSRVVPHSTPQHASWLNVAENEIGVVAKQGLHRRIDREEKLAQEAGLWCRKRNQQRIRVRWTFTRKQAKEKFPTLYAENF